MTCEECIHKAVCYRVDSVKNDYAQKCGDFLSSKSLGQDSYEDTISRQAVLNTIGNVPNYNDEMVWEALSCAYRDVASLPSVNPQPKTGRWIPVSVMLPEENKTVIASTKYGVYPETRYTKEYGWEWAYEAGADYWRELEDVTAWMPLPEPFKAESEDKDDK